MCVQTKGAIKMKELKSRESANSWRGLKQWDAFNVTHQPSTLQVDSRETRLPVNDVEIEQWTK